MSFYARLAMDMTEYTSRQPDYYLPKEHDLLALRLLELESCLRELEAVRPHDRMDPLYDRYFYADFATEDVPYTVQDLLQAIAKVKEQIARRDMQWLERQHFLTAVRNTGADPSGQVVLTAIFLPQESAVGCA